MTGWEDTNDTEDRIFLLSLDDIKNTDYGFSSDYNEQDMNRRCAPTEYAVAQGIYQDTEADASDRTADGDAPCFWWLRSPGQGQNRAARVLNTGDVDNWGRIVNYDSVGVRPALWINLKP